MMEGRMAERMVEQKVENKMMEGRMVERMVEQKVADRNKEGRMVEQKLVSHMLTVLLHLMQRQM